MHESVYCACDHMHVKQAMLLRQPHVVCCAICRFVYCLLYKHVQVTCHLHVNCFSCAYRLGLALGSVATAWLCGCIGNHLLAVHA
jgi:hypothetical protein